jgi:hypothetical protein
VVPQSAHRKFMSLVIAAEACLFPLTAVNVVLAHSATCSTGLTLTASPKILQASAHLVADRNDGHARIEQEVDCRVGNHG